MRLRLVALAGLSIGMPALIWLAFALGPAHEGAAGEPETIHIGARWRTEDAKDLATLVTSSDAVFVGEVSALRGQRLESLTPSGVSRGAPDGASKPPADRGTSLPISAFDVRVTEVWKGDLAAASIVTIEQPGGTIASSGGKTVRLALEGDQLMAVGGTYLFWFAPASDGGALMTTPFKRLELTDTGRLEPLTAWRHLGAMQQISGLPSGDLRRMIAEADR